MQVLAHNSNPSHFAEGPDKHQLPDVATAQVRHLGSKQVEVHQVGQAFQMAHAYICEQAAVQVECCKAGDT